MEIAEIWLTFLYKLAFVFLMFRHVILESRVRVLEAAYEIYKRNNF